MTCKFHDLTSTETYIQLRIRIMRISKLEIKIYINVFGIMQIYNNMQIVNDKNVHQHMSGIKYFIFLQTRGVFISYQCKCDEESVCVRFINSCFLCSREK